MGCVWDGGCGPNKLAECVADFGLCGDGGQDCNRRVRDIPEDVPASCHVAGSLPRKITYVLENLDPEEVDVNAYVVLLRAVNVGGTGKLPMADLRRMCEEEGLEQVRTYIASGNVVCASSLSATTLKERLEARLEVHFGRPVGVLVRDAEEIAHILDRNPFPDAPPSRVMVLFLDKPAPGDAAGEARGLNGEALEVSGREIFIHYPNGQGSSRLSLPVAQDGTQRNMNTVAKLTAMVGEVSR